MDPLIRQGKNILVVAHGNSLRAKVMHLEKLTKEQVLELNIPTGIPYVYEVDENCNVIKKTIL
jgi:2,3-bisphosphoglycerate-dependent phosphoglycerate mutase